MGQYARRVTEMCWYANRTTKSSCHGKVRQKGAFSSFCIPNAELDDPVWREREGGRPRSDYYHLLQREERRALEAHAETEGCRLIIDPELRPTGWELPELISRLSTLAQFLESKTNEQAEVALSRQAREGNLTIVGDWFTADSQVCRPGGYRQTIFNWHAPSALDSGLRFDQQCSAIWRAQGIAPEESRLHALDRIRQILDSYKQQLAAPPTSPASAD